jgi:hypothetical protein
MIPKLTQWFMSEECRALDNCDFYSEQYWMDVDDVELDEDDMNVVSNEPKSTAVENGNCQLLAPAMMKQTLSTVVELLVNHQPRVN